MRKESKITWLVSVYCYNGEERELLSGNRSLFKYVDKSEDLGNETFRVAVAKFNTQQFEIAVKAAGVEIYKKVKGKDGIDILQKI